MTRWTLPAIGVLAAIAATTTFDAIGWYQFSALVLAPLLVLLWFAERMARAEMGFVLGRPAHYLVAALIPVAVMGMLAATAFAAGAVDASHAEWRKVALNFAVLSLATALVAMITEEGFFRGWLWSSLKRRRVSERALIVWTSLAFAAWHISGVVLPAAAPLPGGQVAIYIANAAVIGAMWGLLRAVSGSILVTSVSHGVWNGLAYTLFGEPGHVAALGIADTQRFGPEVGLNGLALNALALAALWLWARPRIGTAARS